MKITYSRGFDLPVAIYCTPNFKASEPGLTLIAREATINGSWEAVGLDGLVGRGRKPSLVLRAATEKGPRLGRGVLSLTGSEFVTWVTSKCLIPSQSSRIK